MQTGITCTHAAMSSVKAAYGKGLCALSADPPPRFQKGEKVRLFVEFQGDDTEAEGALSCISSQMIVEWLLHQIKSTLCHSLLAGFSQPVTPAC